VNAFKKMAEFHNLAVAGVPQHVRPFADLHVSVARIRATGAAVGRSNQRMEPLAAGENAGARPIAAAHRQ
jgi:hypothetical protein